MGPANQGWYENGQKEREGYGKIQYLKKYNL